MKTQAVGIFKLTVAGKLCATFFTGPLLTLIKQFCCKAFLSIPFCDKYTFEVSDRRTVCAFHIIMTYLTLCKSHRLVANVFEKAGSILIAYQLTEILRKFTTVVFSPHLYCQC